MKFSFPIPLAAEGRRRRWCPACGPYGQTETLTGLYGHMSEKLMNLVDSLAMVRTIAFSDMVGSTLQVSRSMLTIVWYSPLIRCCSSGVTWAGRRANGGVLRHPTHRLDATYDDTTVDLPGHLNVRTERVLVVLAFDEHIAMHVVLVQLVL